MAEVLDQLSQLAKDRADSLQRTSRALAGEAERLLFVADDSCDFARFLSTLWEVVSLRLHQGGVPARRLGQECDLLLHLGSGVGQQLALLDKVWQERGLPGEVAQPIFQRVQEARVLLDVLVQSVRQAREWAGEPPRITAGPEELKHRARQADEEGKWVKLTEAVSRMRQGGSPKQE